MSFLSAQSQNWQAAARRAMIFASLVGAATTVGCFAGWFTFLDGTIMAGPRYALGYRIGIAVNMLAMAAGFFVPAALVCFLGLVMFGVPVSQWLGHRQVGLWGALLGVVWGAAAGGLFWAILSLVVSGWEFQGAGMAVVGAIFGAPTGFWWWFFYRRVLLRRAALQD